MRYARLLPIVALLAAASCSDESDSSPAASPIARDALAGSYAAAVCDNIGSCCQSDGLAYDSAACRERVLKQLDFPPASTDGVIYDASAAGQCIASVASYFAACGGSSASSASCKQVFTGTLAAGAACTVSVQCAAPAGGSAWCDGTCIQSPRGKEGDACNQTCSTRPESTVCSGSSSDGGATCFTDDGLVCGAEGKCAKAPALGEACSNYECGADAWCADDGTCAALKADGESCSSPSQCRGGSCENSVCGKEPVVDAALCAG